MRAENQEAKKPGIFFELRKPEESTEKSDNQPRKGIQKVFRGDKRLLACRLNSPKNRCKSGSRESEDHHLLLCSLAYDLFQRNSDIWKVVQNLVIHSQ